MNTAKKNRINPANKQPLRPPTQSLFKSNRTCSINFSGLALGNYIGGRGEDLLYVMNEGLPFWAVYPVDSRKSPNFLFFLLLYFVIIRERQSSM